MTTWLHFGSKNQPKFHQKSIPKTIKILVDVWIDFWTILAPSWDPSWNHVGHLFGQKSPKTASRCVQEPPERRPGAVLEPTAAQDAPRHPPGLDLGAFWPPCWTMFGKNLDNVCHYFRRSYKTRPRPSKSRAPRSLTSGAAVPRALPSSIL